jgi:hypothetical protein
MGRARVFIGCSSETLAVARAIQSNLDLDADVSVWDQGQFAPTTYNLESLVKILERSDFGVFVLAGDDQATIRGRTEAVVRDNVLIELGLFIGSLGRERVAIAVPADSGVRIPSDLNGLTLIKYRADREGQGLTAALGPAANLIRIMLDDLPISQRRPPPEMNLPLLTLRHSLSSNQQVLLTVIENKKSCTLRELRRKFPNWSQSELHYRLEQLRIYSFIHCPKPLPSDGAAPAPIYELHELYVLEREKVGVTLEALSSFPADLLEDESADEQTQQQAIPGAMLGGAKQAPRR